MKAVFSSKNKFINDPYFKDLKNYYDLNSKILKWSGFTLALLFCFVFQTQLNFVVNMNSKNVLLLWVVDLAIIMLFTLLHLIIRAVIINSSLTTIYNLINKSNDKIIKYKKLQSLVEQIYYFIYFSIMTFFGYYIFYQSFMSKNGINIHNIWMELKNIFVPHSVNSPATTHSSISLANYNSRILNLYYLVQISAYLYQLIYILLGLETKRKDHAQMIVHHVVTLILTVGSYTCSLNNFTVHKSDGFNYGIENLKYVGHIIMITTDTTDLFLSLSKILNYLVVLPFQELSIKEKHSKLVKKVVSNVCDCVFLFGFVITWVLGRHYLYNVVVYNCFKKLIPDMQGQLNNNAGKVLGYGNKHLIFVTALVILLLCLQFLQIIWLVLIIKLVYRVVIKKVRMIQKKETENDIVDSRSDDEEEEKVVISNNNELSDSAESLVLEDKKPSNKSVYISNNGSEDTLVSKSGNQTKS